MRKGLGFWSLVAVATAGGGSAQEARGVGAARAFTVDGQDYPVESGSVVFVRANAKHRFHSISEDLTTLVFFAPAETE